MNDIITRIKEKYQQVQAIINQKKQSNRRGLVPIGENFIASKDDFMLLVHDLHQLSEEKIKELYNEEELRHVEATLDTYLMGEQKEVSFEFSKEVSMQICKLLAGRLDNNEELLQTLYMTIFQRFNDDIKVDKNYVITEEFARKLYRFGDEPRHPDVVYPETSEPDMGNIYMDQTQYMEIDRIADDSSMPLDERRKQIRMSMVNYVLRKIRNSMVHGNFKNKYDPEGNKIVQIEPYDFKAKFFFNCIEEVYEMIVDDIKENEASYNKTPNEKLNDEVLFAFQKDILNGNAQDSEVLKDPDKMMRLVLPLFVNSFLTYNFADKGDYKKVRDKLIESGNEEDLEMLNLFSSNGVEDDFISKVERYNGLDNSARVFAHFRNSVVHNNFECENGKIRIRDYEKNGSQSADFIIPYSMFLDFFRQYSIDRNINLGENAISTVVDIGEEPSDSDDARLD